MYRVPILGLAEAEVMAGLTTAASRGAELKPCAEPRPLHRRALGRARAAVAEAERALGRADCHR